MEQSKHEKIKLKIIETCKDLNLKTVPEYRGKDWRADVYASNNSVRFAFEIQISPQSLAKTLARQAKYNRDGIIGCWLFEKPLAKLADERPDLPLFYVTQKTDSSFSVSLSGRKELPIHEFLETFLTGKIKFCNVARTKPIQHVKLVFFEMECWKCKAMNHIYYVEAALYSACNAIIQPMETMWGSDHIEHRPEIIKLARNFINTEKGRQLKLGEIKSRFSRTVQDSYASFGCYKCDSIFGDWYVSDAQLEAMNGYGQVATLESDVKFDSDIELPIPHWCYPGDAPFCDSTKE
jgi:hypothetical protein